MNSGDLEDQVYDHLHGAVEQFLFNYVDDFVFEPVWRDGIQPLAVDIIDELLEQLADEQ